MIYKREFIAKYPGYQVDTNGVVYGKNSKPLHPCINVYGYPTVSLSMKNKKCAVVAVHTLVATQFIKREDENASQVLHIDGNKENNNVDNLKWVTRSEAMKHTLEKNNFNSWKRKPIHLWNDHEDYTFESFCEAERFLTGHLGFTCHRGNICSAIKHTGTAYGYHGEYL